MEFFCETSEVGLYWASGRLGSGLRFWDDRILIMEKADGFCLTPRFEITYSSSYGEGSGNYNF